MPDPILLRCPHCQHALQIPEEFLGQVVTCLQCRGPFRAPTVTNGVLGQPELLPKKPRIPARLFIPTYGLLLLGFAGLLINVYLAIWMSAEPKAAMKFAEANLFFMLETDPKAVDGKDKSAPQTPEEAKARRDELAEKQEKLTRDVAENVSVSGMIRIRIIFAIISAGVLMGGFCFALRRGYYLAFASCALSAVNSPDIGCCFVGVVVGIWGFMMLISDEGRVHFRIN